MPPRSIPKARKRDLASKASPTTLSPSERCKAVWGMVSTLEAPKFDLLVICEDGLEVWCHQSVLASASKGLAELLRGQGVLTGDGGWRTEEVTIILPGVQGKDLGKVLCVLYNGYAKVTVKAAEELKRVWKQLGIDIVRLNNKDKIEVVNLENMVGMEKNKYFVEETISGVKPPSDARVKVEQPTATLEETVIITPARVKREPELDQSTYYTPGNMNTTNLEDPLSDPDDPSYEPAEPVRPPRGRKRKSTHGASPIPVRTFSSSIPLPTRTLSSHLPKKTKIECGSGSYYVEEIHTCLMCNGKTPDGRVDKEASNLSFRDIKRLREHYSKHLYNEGKIFKHVPGEPGNVDDDGKVVDEFGSKFKYNCTVKNCWKSTKPACGYKEMALHNVAEHEILEKVLADDDRPVLKRLLEQIEDAKEKERIATQPLSCIIPQCPDSETLHTNHGDYQSLKGHYSTQHWRSWFLAAPEPNKPRMQKVKEPRRGTPCNVCQAKVFGDENSMMEHYAVIHDQLLVGIMDTENSGVDIEHSKAVIQQLYPNSASEFEKKVKEKSS